jgi:hypothetical protein
VTFDPYARPLGYWSEQGEAWTEARMLASAPTVYALGRAQRDLAQERAEVADLAAELHARGGELAHDLARRMAALSLALAEDSGFVGIDLVWHARLGPVVIEINPRLTCAYAGLSAALGRNLAAEIVTAPVNVLVPESVVLPEPSCVNWPPPLMTFKMVMAFDLLTANVEPG